MSFRLGGERHYFGMHRKVKILRTAYFRVIKQREVVNFLQTFRVNLSGPSSEVNDP